MSQFVERLDECLCVADVSQGMSGFTDAVIFAMESLRTEFPAHQPQYSADLFEAFAHAVHNLVQLLTIQIAVLKIAQGGFDLLADDFLRLLSGTLIRFQSQCHVEVLVSSTNDRSGDGTGQATRPIVYRHIS